MDAKQEMILIIAKYCGVKEKLNDGLEVFIYKEGIEKMVDELVYLLPKHVVSKPFNDLKKLLAEMTIELITTKKECRESHLLIRNIEEAKESLKVLNNVC